MDPDQITEVNKNHKVVNKSGSFVKKWLVHANVICVLKKGELVYGKVMFVDSVILGPQTVHFF